MVRTYFKAVLQTRGVDLMESRSEGVSDQFLNLREDVSLHVEVDIRLLGANDFAEVLEAHLVGVFKFAVVV